MAKAAKSAVDNATTPSSKSDAKAQVVAEAANEFVFAVVGHVGSGTSEVARSFKELLERQTEPFDTTVIKGSEVIEKWATSIGKKPPERPDQQAVRSLQDASVWQDLGDTMREKDLSSVAKGLIQEIRSARASACKATLVDGEPVIPDGKPRAYVLDALGSGPIKFLQIC